VSLAPEEANLLLPIISALSGLAGAALGGSIALYGQRAERIERRRLSLLEAYGNWIAASDLLSQCETKVFVLWLQGMETPPSDVALHKDLGDEMRKSWNQSLSAEAAEGASRARILLLDWGSSEVRLVFEVADIKLNNVLRDELQKNKIAKSRDALEARFFDLERGQAELRTKVVAGVHKRLGSKLTA